MKQICEGVWLELVELAEGKPNAAAVDHVGSCAGCQRKLTELQRVFAVAEQKHYAAPADVVNRAKSIFVPQVRRFGLLSSSLQLIGARGAAEDFQAVYGLDSHEIRVMYSKVDAGWEVISRVPENTWKVSNGPNDVRREDDGHFFFLVRNLEESGFRISVDSLTLEVPNALEAIRESERPS